MTTPVDPSEDEIIRVRTPVVHCDGGGGPLGHPTVYLHIGADGTVVCPYCSRRFALADGVKAEGH